MFSSKKNKLSNNTINKPGKDGIYLEKSNDTTINLNNITKAKRDGINIINSKKIILTSNTITDSKRYGIKAEKNQIKKDSKNKISKSGTKAKSWK